MFRLQDLYLNEELKQLLINMMEIREAGGVYLIIYEKDRHHWEGRALSHAHHDAGNLSFPRFDIRVDSATPENAGVKLVAGLRYQVRKAGGEGVSLQTRISTNVYRLAVQMVETQSWCSFGVECLPQAREAWNARLTIQSPHSDNIDISTTDAAQYESSSAHAAVCSLLANTLTISAKEAVRLARLEERNDIFEKVSRIFSS